MKILSFFIGFIVLVSCQDKPPAMNLNTSFMDSLPLDSLPESGMHLVVLGTIQDAGSPQIGCQKKCCKHLYDNPDPRRKVTCLGVVDQSSDSTFLFEASPDIVSQMELLSRAESDSPRQMTDGIFLTHAHIGHYTGLMYLGKEAIDADKVPVYAMPRMTEFLSNHGPWDHLLVRNNIKLNTLKADEEVRLKKNLKVTPLLVPHRDEYSETVGYLIEGPSKSALFIPDIDKWEKWERDIIEMVKQVDLAFLDATFYSGVELNNRDITQIPHPFIIESFEKFEVLSQEERSKIHFIHFNHTNPVINPESPERKKVEAAGYHIAELGDVFEL